MYILKKKIDFNKNNFLTLNQIFLKNLDFNKKLKKQDQNFIKLKLLYQTEDSSIFSFNKKENYTFPNINLIEKIKRNTIIFNIETIYNQNILLKNSDLNYYLVKLYINTLLKNFKKYLNYYFFISNEKKTCFLKNKKPFYKYFKGLYISKNRRIKNKRKRRYFFKKFPLIKTKIYFGGLILKCKKEKPRVANRLRARLLKKKPYIYYKLLNRKFYKKFYTLKLLKFKKKKKKYIIKISRSKYIFDLKKKFNFSEKK